MIQQTATVAMMTATSEGTLAPPTPHPHPLPVFQGRTLEEMIRKEGRKSVPSMIRRKRMAVKQGPPEGVTVKSREEREFDA